MAWSYDIDQLATKPLYQVRLKIGDTLPEDPQLQDEELQVLLDANANHVGATALDAALLLRAKYSRYVDKWVGDLKILASQRLRAYERLIEELQVGGAGIFGRPFAGGIRVSQKEAVEEDTDLVKPFFRRNLHDYQEP